jgi:hypothetical protein
LGSKESRAAAENATLGLKVAKHGDGELEYVRRWKNPVADALRTGRSYDAQIIRAIEVIQVADGLAAGRARTLPRKALRLLTHAANESPPRREVEAGGCVGCGRVGVVQGQTPQAPSGPRRPIVL